jgi:hypothetical protein
MPKASANPATSNEVVESKLKNAEPANTKMLVSETRSFAEKENFSLVFIFTSTSFFWF